MSAGRNRRETKGAYAYDASGRVSRRDFANGIRQTVRHDERGRLAGIEFSGGPLEKSPVALRYFWDEADQVAAREWNGVRQEFGYDASGQLLTVTDAATGRVRESYRYDDAGNMLEKVIDGETVTMTYDAANQLTAFTAAGQTAKVTYDRAGRLTTDQRGHRTEYGWLDRPVKTTLPDGRAISFSYHPDGQLAVKTAEFRAKDAEGAKGTGEVQRISHPAETNDPSATSSETYLWDGLALLRRGDEIFINEPHPSGGAVVASYRKVNPGEITFYLNDLLGTTLATVQGDRVEFKPLTAFGQPLKAAVAPDAEPLTPTATAPTMPANQSPAMPAAPN